jgi:putative acetyltransferase
VTLVRAEEPRDRAAVRGVVGAAFGGPAEADLVDALRAGAAWLPELSLVAEEDGRVVGHVLFTRATADEGTRATDILALAPLAVLPSHQRRGIGGALVRAGLRIARARGDRAVVLIGHPSYYPRFGFVPAVPLGLSSVFAQGAHEASFLVLGLREGALAGLSGAVRYAPEFDAFA